MREKFLRFIDSSSEIIIILIVSILVIFSSGCSTMHIVKDCHAVEELDGIYVCKNLKPWE